MMTDKDKIRLAKAAYARRYRKEHPDKVNAAQEKYWLKRAKQEGRKDDAKTVRPE